MYCDKLTKSYVQVYRAMRDGPKTSPRSSSIKAGGFTLLELMITLAILTILIAVAVPSFRDAVNNSQRRAALSSVNDAIALARTEAVTRSAPVILCASANHTACSNQNLWERGFIVTIGGAPEQVWQSFEQGISIRAYGFSTNSAITFGAEGDLVDGGSVIVCDGQGDSEAIGVIVNVSGLSRIATDSDNNGVVEDHTGSDVVCPA